MEIENKINYNITNQANTNSPLTWLFERINSID